MIVCIVSSHTRIDPCSLCWRAHAELASPFPQIDILRAMMIVWTLDRKRENYEVCSVQYYVQHCAQCNAHT